MHYWRLLLLAFLAAIQPITSFTDRNLVDGRQKSRKLYGTPHIRTITPEDRRFSPRVQAREGRSYELKNSVVVRASSSRLADSVERQSKLPSIAAFRSARLGPFSPHTEAKNRNIVNARESRENVLREIHVKRNAHMENERKISNLRDITRLDNRVHLRRAARQLGNEHQEVRDEERLNIFNEKDRHFTSERRDSFRISRFSDRNLAERQSPIHQTAENNMLARRSLSVQSKMSDLVRNERDLIRENRIRTRSNERIPLQKRRELETSHQRNEIKISSTRRLSVEQNRKARNFDRRVTRVRINGENLPVDLLSIGGRNIGQTRIHREEIARHVRNQEDFRKLRNDLRHTSSVSREENVRLSWNAREIGNSERTSEEFANEINELYNRNIDKVRTDTRLAPRRENSQEIRDIETYSRTVNRENKERNARTRQETRNDGRRSYKASREGNERVAISIMRQIGHDERISNRSVRSIVLSRQGLTISRELRNEEYYGHSKRERFLRSRREIRNDPMQTERSSDRQDVRIERQDRRRSMDRQALSNRVSGRDRRTQSEVRQSLNRESLPIEVSRSPGIAQERERQTRVFSERQSSNERRNIAVFRNREILASYIMEKDTESSTFALNWQKILYTMQGIYLCGFLVQMLSHDESVKVKARGLSWFLSSNNLVKAD